MSIAVTHFMEPMRMPVLESAGGEVVARLTGVHKLYRAGGIEAHALSDIHLDQRRGELIAITGPSGGGKTTLLNMMGLLDVPTSGSYRLQGEETTRLGARARARIRAERVGVVFQSFNLVDDLTVEANVQLPLVHRHLPADECARRAAAALDRVGMSGRTRHYPSQLSGGEQQRVAIARAIAGIPMLLLADEPTGSLDSRNGDAVMGLLRELHADGMTICIATHDSRYARQCERTIHLVDGRIAGERAYD